MSSSQTIILAITGGIACGKTETGRILSAEGFKVLDCDFLAHELMAAGRPVFQAVVDFFGADVLAADGEIDRVLLGRRVFSDPVARAELNRLTHPAVLETARRWRQECIESGEDAAVLVPLLFETGWTDGWDAVVCLTATEEEVFRRLEQRGLSRDEARRRIAAQWPLHEKAARAEIVIENNETPEALRRRVLEMVERVRDGKRKRYE
jgi:dephospho-CoA kinase